MVHQTPPCHIRLFLIISRNTSRSSLYISHSPTTWVPLYCFATRHSRASTSSCRLLVHFVAFLAGTSRSPTRTRSFSVFAKSTGPCKMHFSFLSRRLTPRKSSSISPLAPYVLELRSLSPISIMFSTLVSYLANFSTDMISFWFCPISFHTFSTTLSHHSPARPFVTFSHTALIDYCGQPLF